MKESTKKVKIIHVRANYSQLMSALMWIHIHVQMKSMGMPRMAHSLQQTAFILKSSYEHI